MCGMVSIQIILFVYIFVVSSIKDHTLEYIQILRGGTELLPVVPEANLEISRYRVEVYQQNYHANEV
jgi:hypothetical protein